jgi:hypothetical protein
MAARTEYSFTAALAALEVGEVASRAIALDPEHSIAFTAQALSDYKSSLSNSVRASIRGAEKSEGHKFSVETVHQLTERGVYVISLVTRIA